MVLVKVTLESLIRCGMVCTVQPWTYSILPLLMPSISLCPSLLPLLSRSNLWLLVWQVDPSVSLRKLRRRQHEQYIRSLKCKGRVDLRTGHEGREGE